MDRQYALEIIDALERHMLDRNCSLAKEAMRYLKKLKSTTDETLNRIYRIQYGKT